MLGALPIPLDPKLLVGFGTRDDAAIYKLTDDIALALTIDIFTPVVDDPYQYGAIAAANALSDVYAMGAKPIAMLSFVGFPKGVLPWDTLQQMLLGGVAKAREAGCDVVGGHSVEDPEPKCGYAVIGVVHPDKVITNAGGRADDVLILTKPIGSGFITTALSQGMASVEEVEQVTQMMAKLNRDAADVMSGMGIKACTDVTGFGLLGHLHEMALASGLTAHVDAGTVPRLPGLREHIAAGHVSSGTWSNQLALQEVVIWEEGVDDATRLILCDAQTSGGLLMAVPPAQVPALVAELDRVGTLASSQIGRLTTGPAGDIHVHR